MASATASTPGSSAPSDVPDAGTPPDGPSTPDAAGGDECPESGNVSFTLSGPEAWPADVRDKIQTAMDEAIYYYNCYSTLTHHITVKYSPGVPTAEGNVDGQISFGENQQYMVLPTALHELGHTLGVGYSPWQELIQDGRWVGESVVDFITQLPAEQRDPDSYSQRTYITCDNQHFWPYGLNQASEYQSEWSLINHVRIVAAMNADKAAYRAAR